MALTRGFASDAAFPNATDLRKQLGAIYPKEGLFPDPVTTLAAGVAYAGSGWGVNARPFGVVTKRGAVPFTQAYGSVPLSNDAVVTSAWTVPAAPGSGSQISLLWVRQKDFTNGDSNTGAPTDGPAGATRAIPEFGVTSGTAATTPVAPSLPPGAVLVATVTTTSGQASIAAATIVQSYAFAFVIGGLAYFWTAATLLAWTTNIPVGQRGYALDTLAEYEWNGTSWAIIESDWMSYTPTWAASVSAPVLGNGTILGRYRFVGRKAVAVRIFLTVGSTTSGGQGGYSFSLPPGMTAHASGEQVIAGKLYVPTSGDYPSFGLLPPGASVISSRSPLTGSSSIYSATQGASSGGAPGTGVPAISGQYTFQNGTNLGLEGVIEIA